MYICIKMQSGIWSLKSDNNIIHNTTNNNNKILITIILIKTSYNIVADGSMYRQLIVR